MQIHLDPSYIDKTGPNEWTILKPFVMPTCIKPVLIWDLYKFNKDSVVRNSPDWIPSCIHDNSCEYQIFIDGSIMTRLQADVIYYVLNMNSKEAYNRTIAARNFHGVRLGSWVVWHRPGRPKQLPAHAEMLRQCYLRTGSLGVA